MPGHLAYADKNLATVASALTRACTPEVAPVMARALAGSAKTWRQSARAWLLEFADAAAIGLIPSAVGKAGPAR